MSAPLNVYYNNFIHNLAYMLYFKIDRNGRKRTFGHARPRSPIRVFVVRMKNFCIIGFPKCAMWRFWSDYANEQADLNHHRAHMSKGTVSDVAVQMYINIFIESH